MWIETLPFWVLSPRLPIRVYDLPIFDKFLDAPLQNSLPENFFNTSIYFVFCNWLFKKLRLKDFYNMVWYLK